MLACWPGMAALAGYLPLNLEWHPPVCLSPTFQGKGRVGIRWKRLTSQSIYSVTGEQLISVGRFTFWWETEAVKVIIKYHMMLGEHKPIRTISTVYICLGLWPRYMAWWVWGYHLGILQNCWSTGYRMMTGNPKVWKSMSLSALLSWWLKIV